MIQSMRLFIIFVILGLIDINKKLTLILVPGTKPILDLLLLSKSTHRIKNDILSLDLINLSLTPTNLVLLSRPRIVLYLAHLFNNSILILVSS